MGHNDNAEETANKIAKYSQNALKIAVILTGIWVVYNYFILLFDMNKSAANIGFIGIMVGTIICFLCAMILSIVAYITKKTKITKTILIMNVAITIGIGGLFLFLAIVIVF